MKHPPIATYCTLIDMAMAEDHGTGDVTSALLFPEPVSTEAHLVTRETLVICGMTVAQAVLSRYHPQLHLTVLKEDGQSVGRGEALARITGPLVPMLAAERVVLNFLQRLCGIATVTRHYVDSVAETGVKIYDTRKTTPGWRYLEKYAVRCGGGYNHRMGLYDGVLIKDNHLAEFGNTLQERLLRLVEQAHAVEGVQFIEVEVDGLDQLEQVLAVPGIDIVLLDNMDETRMREAVAMRDQTRGNEDGPLLEASGGITLDNVAAAARSGVERIAIGALTHSARAMDIGLDR